MKTKIYGTIGPACCTTEMLVRLLEKGMTGIRINLSHSNLEDAKEWIADIHKAYHMYCSLAENTADLEILMDLRGPELRIGKLHSPRKLAENDMVTLVLEGKNNLFDPTEIPVPELVLAAMKTGQEILIDDGKILLQAEDALSMQQSEVSGMECRVLRGGMLKSGKSIAAPGTVIEPPTLTKSDFANIKTAKKYGITGVMLPFVRGKEDLINLKEALREADSEAIRVFAKIENATGLEKLPELLPYCDEIVIARGDLGNAMPLWKLPVVQRNIAEMCKKEQKDFMVVTQMLASMEQASVPTRAEVSDIFRAINEGAASVMLTGETAAGDYPVEAMEYMVNTVREAENYLLLQEK